MASKVNRSRSALTMTSSMTHCRKNGETSVKTSSATASNRIWPIDLDSPDTGLSSARSLTVGAALRGWKELVGHSSSATPVNECDTSASESLRTPWAGS